MQEKKPYFVVMLVADRTMYEVTGLHQCETVCSKHQMDELVPRASALISVKPGLFESLRLRP